MRASPLAPRLPSLKEIPSQEYSIALKDGPSTEASRILDATSSSILRISVQHSEHVEQMNLLGLETATDPIAHIDEDIKSDASSICCSPSWSDFGDKKKRHKRTSEAKAECIELERQQKLGKDEKMAKRSSKSPQKTKDPKQGPPTLKKLTKPAPLDRSTSTPVSGTLDQLSGYENTSNRRLAFGPDLQKDVGRLTQEGGPVLVGNRFIGGIKLRLGTRLYWPRIVTAALHPSTTLLSMDIFQRLKIHL